MQQNLKGESWDKMLSDFAHLVSHLYMEWKDCLVESLEPESKPYFESILLKTASKSDLKQSLLELSYFLHQKFGQKVIVLIDNCQAPYNSACEHDYFNVVCPLFPL